MSCMAFSVFADEAEKKEIAFEVDKTFTTTETGSPTVSFDGDDWNKYVHLTKDASRIGLKISIDKTTFYQGFSLKASASGAQNSELYMNAGMVRDSDNKLVYPAAEEEGAKFLSPGVELRCEDFGLSCFDGCFITFYYKIGTDAKDKLMGDSIYVFSTDSDYTAATSSVVSLTYDVLMNNNVSQYRTQSVTVPANSSSTRIVFETPVLTQMDSDVLCLDNITIMLPTQEDGKDLYIKNLDGYNASAKPQETIEALQVEEKKTSTVEIADTPEKQEGGKGFVVVIVIIVAVIAGGVGGFFFYKKIVSHVFNRFCCIIFTRYLCLNYKWF